MPTTRTVLNIIMLNKRSLIGKTHPLWLHLQEFLGDFPSGSDSKASVCLQCRRPGFNPRVGKISWRRKWQPTPIFLPGKSHGWRSLVGYKSKGSQRVGHDFTFTFFSQEFLNKQNYSEKKNQWLSFGWAMTVMKHAVSVTQSVCICQNFVKKTFKICASVSVLCINRKKKSYEENIEFQLYMHIKASQVSEMYWYLKFTLNYIKN